MAPETIRGAVQPGEAYLVDAYALGILAFELVTGDLPFNGEGVRKIFWLHLTQEPPKVTDKRPSAPPRLSQLVSELLAKEPSARPQSMEEVSWRLQHLGAPSSQNNYGRRHSDPPPSRAPLGKEGR